MEGVRQHINECNDIAILKRLKEWVDWIHTEIWFDRSNAEECNKARSVIGAVSKNLKIRINELIKDDINY